MLKRLQPRMQRAAMAGLACLALIVAACTRSAGTSVVPTAGPTGIINSTEGVQQPSDQDATMGAIGTQVSGQLTQTAVAANGGDQGTPKSPDNTPEPGATDIPPVDQPTTAPGDTPVPQPTLPSEPDTATPVPAGGACANPYTVQSGDWLYKIARNCNVSVAALIAANPNINPNALTPGQLLNMPGPGATPAAGDPQGSGCSGTHIVQTGDSLYRLAFACGLTVEQLAAQNGITYPYTIYIGQVLTL